MPAARISREPAAAGSAVAGLTGVSNIRNQIVISNDADPADVRLRVEEALSRHSLLRDNSDVTAPRRTACTITFGRLLTPGERRILLRAVTLRAETAGDRAAAGASWRLARCWRRMLAGSRRPLVRRLVAPLGRWPATVPWRLSAGRRRPGWKAVPPRSCRRNRRASCRPTSRPGRTPARAAG